MGRATTGVMREFIKKVQRLGERVQNYLDERTLRPTHRDYQYEESAQHSRDAVQIKINKTLDEALAADDPVAYMTGVIMAPWGVTKKKDIAKNKGSSIARLPGQLRLWHMFILSRIKTEEISPTMPKEKLTQMKEIANMFQEHLKRISSQGEI